MLTNDLQSLGLNKGYVEILRAQWIENPNSVQQEWQDYFLHESADLPIKAKVEQVSRPDANLSPLTGVAKKIASNMQNSLHVPTATSVRELAVKGLEENRLLINQFLEEEHRPRCSFTHIIAYAIIKSLIKFPKLNYGFLEKENNPFKVINENINLGIAIDVNGKDGERTLLVPNIKMANKLNFFQFYMAYNDIIEKARLGKLGPDDFMGTTASLTNPGGIGTNFSVPRLMLGQGAIFATGSISYPSSYESMSKEAIAKLGISKVMAITSTYDHRIIQGAQSAYFLSYVNELLMGENGFYEEIFQSLKISNAPFVMKKDENSFLTDESKIEEIERNLRVNELIHDYRERGFLLANVNPINNNIKNNSLLTLENYGLSIWDLDRKFCLKSLKEPSSFRDILYNLQRTYTRTMAIEYMHINNADKRIWLQALVENEKIKFSQEERINIFTDLDLAESFEHFLHKRYVGHKRFSIEGAEVVIPMLRELLRQACLYDAREVVIGMAHRGRLNVLANIIGKPYEAIFAEFDDILSTNIKGSGDVKYHLGAKGVYKTLKLMLTCNPSHLEAVNPIVEGMVRAKQDLSMDTEGTKIIPVLIHGDASFAGQGVVYETLQLSQLAGYKTGGTIHLIINNQIGYTTSPDKARSCLNCSDLGKALSIPIFRVNGDDPENAMRAMKMAFSFKHKFHNDVIVELVCYRRHGHNEGDEPSFTQPVLYRAIKDHPSVLSIYKDLLLRDKNINLDILTKISEQHNQLLENAFNNVKNNGLKAVKNNYSLNEDNDIVLDRKNAKTNVSFAVLKKITESTSRLPKEIEIHERVKEHVLDKRLSMLKDEHSKVDFGLAEILAYGSLLLEDISVRLSGQDVGRGTFAHRHAILYDINNEKPYIPLNHLYRSFYDGKENNQVRFQVYDSPLSEAAVLGFEYGYSVADPKSLVLWEAQYGDFFNGAQIQIDQFIAAAESKWGQKSRLVLLLPHGYVGQGPEHSSARMERFLQLCALSNMRICNCSTSGQMFHLLRLQAKVERKPLVIFTHKSLLRAEEASSLVNDFVTKQFERVIVDEPINKGKKELDKLIFMSGKVYYDLIKEIADKNPQKLSIRLVRIEELYPFPADDILNIVNENKAKEIIWLQEEPRNNGAFLYIKDQFESLNINLHYIGRKESASPAAGSAKVHKEEQSFILKAVLDKDS